MDIQPTSNTDPMQQQQKQPVYLNKTFQKFFMTLLQMLVLFVIILAAILNMSINSKADNTIWATLLSACMGYMLPGPNFKNLQVRNGNGGMNGNGNLLDEVDGKVAAQKH